jgi:hypothetical protein
VLSLVRSMKNTFAPINRTPPEVLALIPDYCDTDEELVKLTHICRSWRGVFISRASLWTSLDCASVDQTRVYLERSKASPLDIRLGAERYPKCDALLLTAPHTGRLKALTLTLSSFSQGILELTEQFGYPASLLEKLEICFLGTSTTIAESSILYGNLLSLRELRLSGVLTDLSWTNLTNLTTFDFRQVPSNRASVTRLLDFFERTPLLCKITLIDSLPEASDAPAKRVVSLPNLRLFRISDQPAHSILLNHLRIPTGASVKLKFQFSGEKSPIPDYVPGSLDNLRNISHVTSVILDFSLGMAIQLKGPSGGLYVLGRWVGGGLTPPILDHRILRSLTQLHISTTARLAIIQYGTLVHSKTEKSAYQTLLLMSNLRTLTLSDCDDPSFIFALNPDHSTANTVVCPELEELVLYVRDRQQKFCIEQLLAMVEVRASRGAKLLVVVIVSPREFIPAEKVFGLKSYVSRVEYRLDNVAPRWDALPGEADEVDHYSGW